MQVNSINKQPNSLTFGKLIIHDKKIFAGFGIETWSICCRETDFPDAFRIQCRNHPSWCLARLGCWNGQQPQIFGIWWAQHAFTLEGTRNSPKSYCCQWFRICRKQIFTYFRERLRGWSKFRGIGICSRQTVEASLLSMQVSTMACTSSAEQDTSQEKACASLHETSAPQLWESCA